MFSKIKSRTIKLYNFFKSHKKQATLFSFLLIFGLGAYLTFGTQPAQAADFFSTETIVKAFATILLSAASLMIRLAVFCLSFIIEIAGYNGYLTSTAVQVGWVMVRDLTNMFFVVILLLVAFGTILGLEQYEWKKMLVKFFFAAILVNFSRIICGLIIDISQVVMITFVNGIAATAGGNLITALSLDKIYSLNPETGPTELTNSSEIFGAAVGALAFAALTLGIMAVYVFILLARLLMLWILIVLSPIAFVFSVIPQTEKYASQWWSEFGNHVIVGPVVVFFLWLSFAIVGSGQINSEIEANNSAPESSMPSKKVNGTAATVGISAVMSFEKIANFAIAIGILLVGAKTAQSLGTVGGSTMGKATDFAKKAVMLGSGAAAGMWAVGKAKDLGGKAVSGIKTAAWHMTPVGDWAERMQNFAKRQVDTWKIYRAEGPKLKQEEYIDEKTGERRTRFVKKKEEYVDQKTGEVKEREIDGEYEYEEEDTRSWFQKTRYASREKMLKSRKLLEKTQNQAKLRDDLIDKRITAIPSGLFLRDMPDGFDRIEQGMLAAEKERSEAKTKEFQEYGRKAALESPRFKDGHFQREKGSMAEQIVSHREKAERNAERTKALMSGVLDQYRKGKEGKGVVAAKVEAKFKAEIAEKSAHLTEGGAKLHFMEHASDLLKKQARIAAEESTEHAEIEQLEKKAAVDFSNTDDEFEVDSKGNIVLDKNGKKKIKRKGGRSLLRKQAEAEIEADTYKIGLSNNLSNAKLGIDLAGEAAELEAKRILEEANSLHAKKSGGRLGVLKTTQEELAKLTTEQTKLKLNLSTAETPEQLAAAKKAFDDFELTNGSTIIDKNKLIDDLQEQISKIDNEDEDLKNIRKTAEEKAREVRSKSISWQNASAHARETHAKNALSSTHNKLLGDVEQEEIYKPNGIFVPNEALSENREYYRKRFADMDYSKYTASLGTNILAMNEKIEASRRGEGTGPTEADKAMMAAMLEHGTTKKWLDDGIWRAMAPDLKAKMQENLGWKGKEFNVEKINDLFAIMSTGGDLQFAGIHKKVAKAMDYAVQEMGMSVAQFYDKLENQDFNVSEISTLREKFKDAPEVVDTITNASKMKQYIKTQDDNQAQIQFVTNLRDPEAEGSHTENGGHADNIVSRNKKERQVLVGSSIAQDNVLNEANKLDASNRSGKQSHSYINLDEGSGYATRTRKKAYRVQRGDLTNHLSHQKTNPRYLNHMAGLASAENVEDYFSPTEGLLITGTKVNGSDSGRHTWAQQFSDDGIGLAENYTKVKSGENLAYIANREDALHQQTTNDWFNELIKDQLFINPQDVLMTLAKKSQVDAQDAYQTGAMNITVMAHGKREHITNISKLISLYNEGAFTNDGKPPTRKLPAFKVVSQKTQAKNKRNDPSG